MEEGKEIGSSSLSPLDPFYVELEDIPMFNYDPANSSLIQEKKDEILGLRLSWKIRSRYPESWVNGRKSSKIQEKWLNEAKEGMDFGDLDPYSGVVVGDAVETAASDSSLNSSSTSTDSEESNPPGQAGSNVSRKIWKKVIDGLGHYASLVDGQMQPGPLTGVTWVTNGLVGQGLKDRLLRGSEALEKLARKEGNWHPGTEGRVLNLIDPSMHALIPGQTRILKKPFVPNKRGLVGNLAHFPSSSSCYVPLPKDDNEQNEDEEDDNEDEEDQNDQNQEKENDQNQEKENDQNQEKENDQNQEKENDQNEEDNDQNEEDNDENDEEENENDDTKFQWLPSDVDVDLGGVCHFRSYVNNLNPFEDGEMYGVLEEILSSTFVPLWSKLLTHMRREQNLLENQSEEGGENGSEIDPVVNLKGRRIQVIVRMATTHLTPDNPKHPGGRWHVDGVPEEKIVVVGLHYYSNQNITTARLGLGEKFRVLIPGTGRRRSSRIRDSGELANIETQEGRSIVFSNQLNHRIPTFELENPVLTGHRKLLAFFLVDPGTPIISTARIPCQQRSWYLAQLRRIFSPPLPAEMVEMIASYLDGPMDLKKAKKFRDVMREERNSIIVLVIDQWGREKSLRVKPSANLERVTGSFSSGWRPNQFSYDGVRINYSHTPAQLGMKSGDVIDLYYDQRRD